MKRRELMRHNMSLCGTGRPNSIVNEAEIIDCSELWIMSGRQNEIGHHNSLAMQSIISYWTSF